MPDNTGKHLSRVLTDLHHGGHVVGAEAPRTTAETSVLEDVAEQASPACLDDVTTPFDHLFGDLKPHYPAGHLPVEPAGEVVAALTALGSAMVDAPADGEPNSPIPPVYTY